MKELVRVIAAALVDHPEEVVVTEREENGDIIVNLQVAADDMGKVIGKQGRIAKAARGRRLSASFLYTGPREEFCRRWFVWRTWLCRVVYEKNKVVKE